MSSADSPPKPESDSPPKTDSGEVADWVQVDGDAHYLPQHYLAPRRMAAIGYQVSLLHEHFPKASLLEVGVGSGLSASLCQQMGYEVSTLDVDAKLNPTILASVTEIPADDGAFGAFVCCQVLEHLPWNDSRQALRELARVASQGGVLSVPTVRARLGLRVFPYRGNHATLMLPAPWPSSRRMHCPDQHHWELGIGVSLKDFRAACADVGFKIVYERQPIEHPYHHFFVVTK